MKYLSLLGVMIATLLCAPWSTVYGATKCHVENLNSIVGNNFHIQEINNIGAKNLVAPETGAKEATAGKVHYCFITGSIALGHGASDRANVAALLPDPSKWNGRSLMVGCGGNCGTVFVGNAPLGWLERGYAIWATDDGHIAPPSPSARLWRQSGSKWAHKADGSIDSLRLSAFFSRAVHGTVQLLRIFDANYYGRPAAKSYFAGCSDGGREGLVEAEYYPEDFDGVVAGDPYFDIEGEALSALAGIMAQMRTKDAALGSDQWHLADKIILAKCDAIDGVKDGLIQNPARCDFVPERDLPRCVSNSDRACFTRAQSESLGIILRALTDQSGRTVYPGYPSSNLDDAIPIADNMHYWLGFDTSSEGGWHDPASQPQAWYYGNQTLWYFAGLKPDILSFVRKKGFLNAVVDTAALTKFRAAVAEGDGTTPERLDAFLKAGHKLIIFHGLADGDITPYRTMNFYSALAARHQGYVALRKQAILFVVPGMAHCGGGPGPNDFGQSGAESELTDPAHDVLAALDGWVSSDRSPEMIIATKHDGDEPTGHTLRSIPLCRFPAQARYDGGGPISAASSWMCVSTDHTFLTSGIAGHAAGYNP